MIYCTLRPVSYVHLQDLIRCTGSDDVTQAIGRCLTKEHLTEPSTWWQNLWTVGLDPQMTDTVFERMVCR